MSTTSSIQTRLLALADSLRQIQQQVSRLAKSAFQQDDDSQSENASSRVDLADEIHTGLKEQEEDFELLLQDAQYHNNKPNFALREFVEGEKRDIDIATRLAKHGEDLKMFALLIFYILST